MVGPPHSGKSVFLAALVTALKARGGKFFLHRACPDGEGMWSAESAPETVSAIRRKGGFTPGFLAFTCQAIDGLAKCFPLVLVDCGGRRSGENAEILRHCTHAVVLSSQPMETAAWAEFCQANGCAVIGRIGSSLETEESLMIFGQDVFGGHLYGLDRSGIPAGTATQISRVAGFLG